MTQPRVDRHTVRMRTRAIAVMKATMLEVLRGDRAAGRGLDEETYLILR